MDHSIAHIRNSDGKIQTVDEHLLGVGRLAGVFGSKIGAESIAKIAGMLHDFGKYSDEFKTYITEAVSHPETAPKRGSVDHSTPGGQLLYHLFHSESHPPTERINAELIGNVIYSHHGSLQDAIRPDLGSDYIRRSEKVFDDFDEMRNRFSSGPCEMNIYEEMKKAALELASLLKTGLEKSGTAKFQLLMSFLTRYIFSCLIDADRTDTRWFEEKETAGQIESYESLFDQYEEKLDRHLTELNRSPDAGTAINRLRRQMSDACAAFADRPSGIYTLSIPTGGGKTLSSLRYGLKHAQKYNKDRIIYIVPYTTIIEQNTEEVRKILDDHDYILEHHSNVIENDDFQEEASYTKEKDMKLAKDNWDAPIIFTTMVQFLDAFYASGTRSARRLHNLANSILIFDEVQSVPIHCVSLFNESLNFLKSIGKSSILLCTATQPALDYVKNGIEKIDGEIVPELDEVVKAFKRTEVVDRTEPGGYENGEIAELVDEIMDRENNLLIIMNTKSVVRKLYKTLSEGHPEVPVYHLSTSMCAVHRKDVLKKVRDKLEKGERVICLSTQLIEAGVDISFDCVIRSLAGLDSIAQAAGRCNRHGKSSIKQVYVINPKDEKLDKLKSIKSGAEVTGRILKDTTDEAHGDLLSPALMNFYFRDYYTRMKSDMDYYVKTLGKDLYGLINGSPAYTEAYHHKYQMKFPLLLTSSLKTVGEYFNVIDTGTTSVIVPYDEGKELIADLNEPMDIDSMSALLKKAQQYTVNLFRYEFDQLEKNGGIYPLRDGKFFALSDHAYDKEFGTEIDGTGKMEAEFL